MKRNETTLYERVPLSRIREPVKPSRTAYNDAKLAELMSSMAEIGLLQPIVLAAGDDGTYEVIAGHRRLLAARRLGWTEIDARIRPDAGEMMHSGRIHENVMREELSPTDEALYYAELATELGDTDRVAELVKRPREHIEARLNLAAGDADVFAALGEGKISVGVAQELNRFVSDSDRRVHLYHALRGGATVQIMKEWRSAANARAELEARNPTPQNPTGDGTPPPPPVPEPRAPRYLSIAEPWMLGDRIDPRPCLFCRRPYPEHKMFRHYVCADCADEHLLPAGMAKS